MPDQLRHLVAVGNRLLFMEGLATTSGHVSALDSTTSHVLINDFETPRGQMRRETVVSATLRNEPVEPNAPRPVDEVAIHTGIYRARDDVNAVVHVHPPLATVFAIADVDLAPVHIRGSVIDGAVPVYDRPDKITSISDGDAMASAMGDSNQLLIRGHGAVVADQDVKRAVIRAIVIEANARFQLWASLLGSPIPFTPAETERIRSQNWTERSIEKRWAFYRWKARERGLLPIE